jgi:predicted O-linked N-acetylglucosamine transferase (SPINDLY family)
VQVSWLGYPTTTGLRTMDYLLSDRVLYPDDEAVPGTEAVYRLARPFISYRAPDDMPPPSELPARTRGRVTFGAQHNLAKVNAAVIGAWGAILRAVPDARLILDTRAFTDGATRRRFQALFLAEGVTADRLVLRNLMPHTASLAGYGEVDIALDSFPFSGLTVTSEALWQGVPVVTLAGDRPVGRMGASLLRAIGLEDLVARDVQDYVRIAVALAGDLDRLVTLRGELRHRMAASPLGDGAGFARAVEGAYRWMWRRRCAGERPQGHVDGHGR